MTTKITEIELVESKDLRVEMMDKIEVLEKAKELILLPNTELMTTKMVAEWYEVEFKTVSKVIDRNRDELSENGMVFKKYSDIKELVNSDNMSHLKISRQGSNVFSKRAVLNVGMLLRDSEIAKRVRTALLDQQEVMTDEQKVKDITDEQMLLLSIIQAESPVEQAIAINEFNSYKNRHIKELNSRIDEMKPKEEVYDKFIDGKNNQKMNQVAKVLGIGRNVLFQTLREKGILMNDNTPYQKYINQGYFVVKETPINKGGFIKNHPQTYVTPKGVEYLSKKLKGYKLI